MKFEIQSTSIYVTFSTFIETGRNFEMKISQLLNAQSSCFWTFLNSKFSEVFKNIQDFLKSSLFLFISVKKKSDANFLGHPVH